MAFTPPPVLFCGPADIYDLLSAEGVQSRLDDHRLATAQVVTVVQAAALAATTLSITALQRPLLGGSVLVFDGGGMAAALEVTLSATAPLGSTQLSVQPLAAPVSQYAQATDNGVNVATAQRLVKGCQYGTGQVSLYVSSRYDDTEIVKSVSANRWATLAGSKWICKRQGQSCPQGIVDDWEEALEEMKQVSKGMLHLDNAGTRSSGWPFVSNVTVDVGYDFNKVRVQPQTSEGSPVFYPQYIDWQSALWLEF